MSYTQTQAEKDGWTFHDSLTDKGDNRPDHQHVGAYKRAENGELVQKVGASEEQLLADIEQWENHHLRAPYVAPPPEKSTVPLPDLIAMPKERAKAVADMEKVEAEHRLAERQAEAEAEWTQAQADWENAQKAYKAAQAAKKSTAGKA